MWLWFLGRINKQYKGRGLCLSETFGLKPKAKLVKFDYLLVGVRALSLCNELAYSGSLEGVLTYHPPIVYASLSPILYASLCPKHSGI
jgi:hypothetical protein